MSKETRDTIIAVVCVVVFLFLLRGFFRATFYRIPQNGMFPGHPAGSYLFAWPHSYPSPQAVKRGDIVVFWRTENGARYIFIWRVIGLPGESVKTSGKDVSINGKLLAHEFIRDQGGSDILRERLDDNTSIEIACNRSPQSIPPDAEVQVPESQFFVMGDNRFNARDSRMFGPIRFEDIIGKEVIALTGQ